MFSLDFEDGVEAAFRREGPQKGESANRASTGVPWKGASTRDRVSVPGSDHPRCPASSYASDDRALSRAALVGLSLGGLVVVEFLIGVVVWAALRVRTRRESSRARRREGSADIEDGSAVKEAEGEVDEAEARVDSRRRSFLERWLGVEGRRAYTPVELVEIPPNPGYSSYMYAKPVDRSNLHPSPTYGSLHDNTASAHKSGGEKHQVLFSLYPPAVAASLTPPDRTLYDPPSLKKPVVTQRPTLARLDIPEPLPPPRRPGRHHHAPSVSSQTSYLRRLSRSLLNTIAQPSPPRVDASTSMPFPPKPPTPPPFMLLQPVTLGRSTPSAGMGFAPGIEQRLPQDEQRAAREPRPQAGS
ncbi:hypothetical protein JCM10212_002622 [Sporobolomyces blumeae]